jgi:hypothetical protein
VMGMSMADHRQCDFGRRHVRFAKRDGQLNYKFNRREGLCP